MRPVATSKRYSNRISIIRPRSVRTRRALIRVHRIRTSNGGASSANGRTNNIICAISTGRLVTLKVSDLEECKVARMLEHWVQLDSFVFFVESVKLLILQFL